MSHEKLSAEQLDEYSDRLAFAMRDTCCDFSLGLGSVLECLSAAEREGYVPPIPKEWWDEIRAKQVRCRND